jgi:hypothetical protein
MARFVDTRTITTGDVFRLAHELNEIFARSFLTGGWAGGDDAPATHGNDWVIVQTWEPCNKLTLTVSADSKSLIITNQTGIPLKIVPELTNRGFSFEES